MCEFIITQIVSAIVGLVTGAFVSVIFYGIGRRDANRDALTARLQAHLSSLAFTLARCDPTHNGGGRRGDDGLEPTTHTWWCMISVVERDGFQTEADVLRSIGKEMQALVDDFDKYSEAQKIAKKAEWGTTLDTLLKRHS